MIKEYENKIAHKYLIITLIPKIAFGISEIRGIFKIEIKEKNSNIFSMPYIMGFGELQDRIVIFVDLKNFLSQEQISIVRDISKKKWERITTVN